MSIPDFPEKSKELNDTLPVQVEDTLDQQSAPSSREPDQMQSSVDFANAVEDEVLPYSAIPDLDLLTPSSPIAESSMLEIVDSSHSTGNAPSMITDIAYDPTIMIPEEEPMPPVILGLSKIDPPMVQTSSFDHNDPTCQNQRSTCILVGKSSGICLALALLPDNAQADC